MGHPTEYEVLEARIAWLHNNLYRIRNSCYVYDFMDTAEDMTSLMSWAEEWQDQLARRRRGQEPCAPCRVHERVVPF